MFAWSNHRQKTNRHNLIFITIRIFMSNNNLKIPGKSWVLKFLKSREVVVVSVRGRGGEKCRTALPSRRLYQRTDTWSPVCFSGLFRLQLFVLPPSPHHSWRFDPIYRRKGISAYESHWRRWYPGCLKAFSQSAPVKSQLSIIRPDRSELLAVISAFSGIRGDSTRKPRPLRRRRLSPLTDETLN